MSKKLKVNLVMERKLRNGDWIIISPSSEMLVVEEEVYKILQTGNLEYGYFEKSFELALASADFTNKNIDVLENSLKEPKNLLFKIIRLIFLITGLVSFGLLFFFFLDSGPLLYDTVTLLFEKPITSMILLIIFSSVTTFMHEVMHMFFSKTLDLKKIKLDFKCAVAKVSMTHTWAWSKIGRLTAISSGMILDISILSFLITVNSYWYNRWSSFMISVLLMKILWQFRIKKTTDIKVLIMMLLDDPFLFQEKYAWATRIASIIDFFSVSLMIGIWIIPIIQILTN